MDANRDKSGITADLSPQETPAFAEASVGRRSSHRLSGSLKLARFDARSRLPATNLPSVSLIRSSPPPETFVFIRVYSWLNPLPKNLCKSA